MNAGYQRKSNIELLRVLAMLMVMLYHMQSYVSKEDPTLYRLAFRALCIQGGYRCRNFSYDFIMVYQWKVWWKQSGKAGNTSCDDCTGVHDIILFDVRSTQFSDWKCCHKNFITGRV